MAISAFDLPQVWQKPAPAALLAALQNLRVDPPVWNLKVSRADILKEQETTHVQHRREIAAYLSTIIKSPLAWVDDDDDREAIWTEASKRFSERCGRSAMGEITRRWPFEQEDNHQDSPPCFDLIIREPPLTGDNLGLKTWGSSYVLAQMLSTIGKTTLAPLLLLQPTPPSVLELGSGTGLLGLAAAAVWHTHVVLTDLPEIMPNLRHNVEANRGTIGARGGSVEAGALTWGGGTDDQVDSARRFRLVIVADPLYDDDHPALLAGAIDERLVVDGEARALVMVPLRDETTVGLLAAFRERMAASVDALVCLEERVVQGQDDWGGDDDEDGARVKCWLGIFGRRLEGV